LYGSRRGAPPPPLLASWRLASCAPGFRCLVASGFVVQGAGCRVSGVGCRVQAVGCRAGCRGRRGGGQAGLRCRSAAAAAPPLVIHAAAPAAPPPRTACAQSACDARGWGADGLGWLARCRRQVATEHGTHELACCLAQACLDAPRVSSFYAPPAPAHHELSPAETCAGGSLVSALQRLEAQLLVARRMLLRFGGLPDASCLFRPPARPIHPRLSSLPLSLSPSVPLPSFAGKTKQCCLGRARRPLPRPRKEATTGRAAWWHAPALPGLLGGMRLHCPGHAPADTSRTTQRPRCAQKSRPGALPWASCAAASASCAARPPPPSRPPGVPWRCVCARASCACGQARPLPASTAQRSTAQHV
jgi:hypothetical protein